MDYTLFLFIIFEPELNGEKKNAVTILRLISLA